VFEEIVVVNLTRTLSQIDHIDHMPKFMHRYIENIVVVNDDGYCGYHCFGKWKY
jgi:hypothetical protein